MFLELENVKYFCYGEKPLADSELQNSCYQVEFYYNRDCMKKKPCPNRDQRGKNTLKLKRNRSFK